MKTLTAFAMGLVLLAPSAVRAQDLASIVGTVTDSSGAVVPDAQVTVSTPDQAITRAVKSDSNGDYAVVRVPIGSYTITAEKAGFQKLVRTGITLEVGQTLRVPLQLQVGSVAEEVVVSSNAVKVETETGAVSHVVTSSQVGQLNLEARNFANLATLVPGAAGLSTGFDPSSVGVLANGTISFNGVPGNFNNWEIDSTNNVDQGSGSNSLMLYPSVDSIAEFRISTSNYSAEYGKSGGANIEVVTKSGTTKFHGDLFEFVRNDAFDANDWFLNRAGQPKEPLKRNDWGFTLGGPVFIPGHYNTSRSKTFFFVSEEWRSNREGTVVDQDVPSLRQRQGDFSECDQSSPNFNATVWANGACALPIDPNTGQPFPGDIVPIDPTSQTLLDALVPLPNTGIAHYTKAPSLPTNFREDMFRIDQNIGEKVRVFFRYTQDAYEQDFIPTLWSDANLGTVKSRWTSPAKSAVIHLTQTIRPNLLNEFIASFSADVNTVNNFTGFDSPAGSINKPSGFGVSTIFPGNLNQPKLPGIGIDGGLPFSIAESTGFEFDFWDPQTAFKDNLIWSKGRHTLKMGFFLLDNHINTTTNIGASTQGFFQFSTDSNLSTGNALADMYLANIFQYQEYGRVVGGQPVGGPGRGHWRQWDFEPYFQDDWRVNSHLTLNLGMRYYWLTPFFDDTNPTNDSIFVPSLYDPAQQAQLDSDGNLIPGTGATYLNYGNGLLECGVSPIPKGCSKSYRGTFSPRFGFSWDPVGNGKTAIRGGYAMTWDSSNPLHAGAGFNGNPPTATTLNAFNLSGYQNIMPGPLGTVYFSDIPRTRKWPEIHQFSLGVEHEFPGNNVLNVSYVGSIGHHLQVDRNINQVPIGATTQNVPALAGSPGCDGSGNCDVQTILINNLQSNIFFAPYRGYSTIDLREPSGNSNYSSLQADLRHKTGYGLTYEAAYTWSHTLDNIVSNGVDDSNLRRWYGTSSLNQPQTLTINWIYQISYFKRSPNALVRHLLGGWQVGGIANFIQGPPIDFSCGIAGLSSGIGGPVVCNRLGSLGVKKGMVDDPVFGPTPSWFDPNAVGQVTTAQLRADNEPGMFGSMGKNPMRGPGRNNWDIAVARNFKLPWWDNEGSTLQFRAESFNTFNHTQWSGVNTSCSDQTPSGGSCAGNGFGEVTSAFPARILQFGMKLSF
jgi:Carboxypeptidase regulatory-like domain